MKKTVVMAAILLVLLAHAFPAAAMTTNTKGILYDDAIFELEEKLALWENQEEDTEIRELERMRGVFQDLSGASAQFSKGFRQYIEVLIDISFEAYDDIDGLLFQIQENRDFCAELEKVHKQFVHIGAFEQLYNYAEGRKNQYLGEETALSLQEELRYYQKAVAAYDLCDGWLDSAKRYLDLNFLLDALATPTPEPTPTPTPTPSPTPVPPRAAELGLSVRTVSPGCVEITDYKYNGSNADLVIPERLHEGTIVAIGKQAFDCGNPNRPRDPALISIELPDTVQIIGESAFSGNTLLERVKLPKNLTTIEADAFSHCPYVEEFILPDRLTKIGDYAFDSCSSLKTIVIPEKVTKIGNVAFCYCTSLTEVQMSSRVTTIGNRAFFGCTSLEKINLPAGLTSIGYRSFYGCTSLTNVTVSKSTKIGEEAFSNCPKLKLTRQ